MSATESAKPPKKTRKPKKAFAEVPSVIELTWNLAELPTSQHRAGLAGLVMVVRWLDRRPGGKQGTCELLNVGLTEATLRLNLQGLKCLFDEIYAATREEQECSALLRNRQKEPIAPLREEVRQVPDGKSGKTKEKKVYIYPQTVPRGSLLADADQPADGSPGLWIKLWREMVWDILRSRSTQRAPFEARAQGEPTKDADNEWLLLTEPQNASVDLPSTYFVGSQETTAENVPFLDRPRLRFVLHFWPFAAQLYCPVQTNGKGDREFVGYAIAIPDVAGLEAFCDELPHVLKQRGGERDGYRPREAVVDLAIESGLVSLHRLTSRIGIAERARATGDLVLGFDVVHLANVRSIICLLGSGRVEPDVRMVDEHTRIRTAYWDAEFRRQRVLNLLARREWFIGFDALFRIKPWERFFASHQFKYFPHDAREAFKEANVSDEVNSDDPVTITPEALVYRIVGTYIQKEVKSKTDLTWEDVKDKTSSKEGKDYDEAREKVAKKAFLAVRSRTGADFVEYFTSTLCSVPHHLGEVRYLALSRVLLTQPETIRTLTMLALSARG